MEKDDLNYRELLEEKHRQFLEESESKKSRLERILDTLFVSKYSSWIMLFWILMILTLGLISLSSQFTIVTKKTELEKGKLSFFVSLDNLFVNMDSKVLDIQPMKTIFNSIDRQTNGVLFNYGFINVLEDYYRLKIDSTLPSKTNNIVLLNFIRKEIEQEPFRQLQPEQQRILTSLSKSIISKDTTLAMVNLSDLNDVMRISNTRTAELENENKYSLPLAIVGTILTFVFGIIALFKKEKKPIAIPK
jgi:hypothetical protein